MPFPHNFLWGVATSSYQIEGAVDVDGRGPSIWDTFSHTPGATENGETGDVACDHYRRWADDVELMTDLGLRAYRFSIAWPRIVPEGSGRVEQRGLDFYSRLVDRLLERGITPVPTLYHWDLPQALQDRYGGWTSRETALRFAEYADVVFRALGDRVSMWITLNEPWVAAFIGYWLGVHAPGIRDLGAAVSASHNLLVGHGLALQAYRARQATGQIGITLNLQPAYPATDSDADRAAARLSDGYTDRWFLDPVFGRGYPADMVALYADHGVDTSFAGEEDMRLISGGIDFLGVNYYTRRIVATGDEELAWTIVREPEDAERTDFDWVVIPEALDDLFARLRNDYPSLPIYVTENGAAYRDVIGPDGAVDDRQRISFLERHIAAAERAIAEGTDLRGYLVWSLLDNFEWAAGYWPRFGIVYVDFGTQRRVPKASAHWYRDWIASHEAAQPPSP
jgi:beta-glucosidase